MEVTDPACRRKRSRRSREKPHKDKKLRPFQCTEASLASHRTDFCCLSCRFRSTMTFAHDITDILPGTPLRAQFESDFKSGISEQMTAACSCSDYGSDKVIVESISVASVLVTFSIIVEDPTQVTSAVSHFSDMVASGASITVAGYTTSVATATTPTVVYSAAATAHISAQNAAAAENAAETQAANSGDSMDGMATPSSRPCSSSLGSSC